MKNEYVVICLDQRLWGCKVSDETHGLVNLTNRGLFYQDRIITCQIAEVIGLLSERYGNINRFELLDFECLDREVRQSVEYCENNQEEWSPQQMVEHYTGKELPTIPEEQLGETLALLTDCYKELKRKGADEWERIETIEIPVNQVLYDLEMRGIDFLADQLEDFCRMQHKKLYKALNCIQHDFNQVDPNIEAACASLNIPSFYIKHASLKTICTKFPVLEPFRDLEKAERNLKILTYLSSVRKKVNVVKPLIKPFGTRTARIILREPSLQNISREFRNLLNVPPRTFFTYRYLYVDYCQFEAGILAGLIKNNRLIKLYESNGIYSEIERIMTCDRAAAKVHFYCFIYGGKCDPKLKNFFETYCPEEILIPIITQRASSLLGNYRYFDIEKDGHKILNHVIQSTGSLIFKQALIDVFSIYHGWVDLILPLHDGALYRIYDANIKDEDILRIYGAAFKKWLTGINPIVKCEPFFI